ncbi:MAG: Crp/Fnr family transcriptional regulator [Flavobacteriales bacterium]|nr:Crp/Fnr family transcriptional regulator [Flavobacteriales bacterium]
MEQPDGRARLAEAIGRLVPLTAAESARFVDGHVTARYEKKELLLQAGEVCDFEAFVVKGCLRIYFIDEAGRTVTMFFAPENWWAADLASFTQRMPSRFFIEAVEPTEVLMIRYAKKEELFAGIPKLERAFRLTVQRHLSALQDRFIQVLSATAEVCYADFLVKYPTLSGRIPQTLIASYVGITPEFLSKLRARMSRGA